MDKAKRERRKARARKNLRKNMTVKQRKQAKKDGII